MNGIAQNQLARSAPKSSGRRAKKARALALLVFGVVAACGPELTDPASTNISGTWVSPDTAALATDFRLQITQAADGEVVGAWFAKGVAVNGACPPALGCSPTNSIAGSNTVFQVFLDLVGLGLFTGQVESNGLIRGSLDGKRISFTRVPAVAGASAGPRSSP